jgi:hypothetical protein
MISNSITKIKEYIYIYKIEKKKLIKKKKKKRRRRRINLVFPSCSETHSSNSYPTSELHNVRSTDAYILNPPTSMIRKRKGKEKETEHSIYAVVFVSNLVTPR